MPMPRSRSARQPLRQITAGQESSQFAQPRWHIGNNLEGELLAKLRDHLRDPPPNGDLWPSSKIADCMTGELGSASFASQRGWEAH
jgi:hypothetical protein